MTKVPYSLAVGSLVYVMICTCPNMSQAVSVVSRLWLIWGKSSRKPSNGFSDISMEPLKYACILEKQMARCLVMLI